MSAGGALALRYARAVFGLGDDAAGSSRLADEIDALTDQILESEELQNVLFQPIHPRAERREVIGELATKLELSIEVRAFARLLVEENRIHSLPAIRSALRELVDRAEGKLEAQVTSARPLGNEQQEQLRQVLSQRFGAQITLELDVDESLIGGLIARVGDRLLDASIRTQLETLGANLKKGSVS
ncbi:MAG: ATP synthase F1 subunit delta [bacterium]|nr:ATP synthase F1 subunit delta [bacterium]